MTWSDDGRRWFVDDRPWLDEFRWEETLRAAGVIQFDQRNATPGTLAVAKHACGDCLDTGFLSSYDAGGACFVVFCPRCRPVQYRRQVTTPWLTWSHDARGRGEEAPAWMKTA